MLLLSYCTNGRATERKAEEGSLQWWRFLSGALLGENTTKGTKLTAVVCTVSALSSALCSRRTSLGSLQERIKDTVRKRGCMLLGFIKGELCHKNLISYQRKLIGFPGKGNTAGLSGYQQSIWYDATWGIICSVGDDGVRQEKCVRSG